MEEFVSSVDEFDLRMDEIRLALKKCRDEQYALAPVKEAANLIVEYIEWTTDPDLQEALWQMLTRLKERRAEAKLIEDREDDLLGGGTVDVPYAFPLIKNEEIEIGKLFNTALIESQRSCNDNVLVFYGALESELLYIVRCYAKGRGYSLRIVNCEELIEKYGTEAGNCFASLSAYAGMAKDKEIFVYTGISALSRNSSVEEAFCCFLKKIRKETGVLQYVLSTDVHYSIEKIYRDWVKKTYPDAKGVSVYAETLNFLRVRLPEFGFVKGQIRYAFKIEEFDEETEKEIKKSYYLLGYEGLSKIIDLESTADWKAEAARIVSENQAEFEEFFKNVAEDIGDYVPDDWQFRRGKQKKWQTRDDLDAAVLNPSFKMQRNEYDTIDNLKEIQDRLDKILNYEGVSVRQKCGWACSYALYNGDVFNNLVGLAEENPKLAERIVTERYELAYDALAALMRVPRGKLIFDLPKKGATGGLCCDGGKTIRLNVRYIDTKHPDDVLEGRKTILHELFHALQHESMRATDQNDKEKLDYYWAHFDISASRIQQWRDNNSRYRSPLEGAKDEDYRDQIFEADARVFADDRLAEFSSFNPPLLDE